MYWFVLSSDLLLDNFEWNDIYFARIYQKISNDTTLPLWKYCPDMGKFFICWRHYETSIFVVLFVEHYLFHSTTIEARDQSVLSLNKILMSYQLFSVYIL